jgi:putative ABC transport system permease protein
VIALSKDFVKLSAIAIAFPLTWWVMTKWLEDFSYRTNMSWSNYLEAGSVLLLLAISTVSFHGIKAAIANPANSFRSE